MLCQFFFNSALICIYFCSAAHTSVLPFDEDASFENVRPRSYYTFKIPELEPGMTVLANFNIDAPKERGFW